MVSKITQNDIEMDDRGLCSTLLFILLCSIKNLARFVSDTCICNVNVDVRKLIY